MHGCIYVIRFSPRHIWKSQLWQHTAGPTRAWGEGLSHHTCKMKSCAPPGMHNSCVIHHIRHYQSFNDGFSSTPMLAFLSQSSHFSPPPHPPTPNNKFSHFSCNFSGVAWRLEKLLWPGGRQSSMWACFASARNVCRSLTQPKLCSIRHSHGYGQLKKALKNGWGSKTASAY